MVKITASSYYLDLTEKVVSISRMKIEKTLTEIDLLVRSRFPIIYLVSHEEERVEQVLFNLAETQKKQLYSWTATKGMKEFDRQGVGGQSSSSYTDPTDALHRITTTDVKGFYLLKDFHPFLNDPHVVRRLRDCAQDLKGTFKTIFILAPLLNLPPELEKEITIIDIPLPCQDESKYSANPLYFFLIN